MSARTGTPGEIAWEWETRRPDFEARLDVPPCPDYELLRDALMVAFNPRDEDAAEPAIMLDTIDRVWKFLVSYPCTCTPGAGPPDYDLEPCDRCQALGRAQDRELEQ